MAELLTLMNIADMHLHHRGCHCLYGVHQCQAIVGVCTSIQDDSVVLKAHLVYLVYQLAFDVALIKVQLYIRIRIAQYLQILLKALLAIDLRFSFAQEIEIRAVDDLYSHNISLFLRVQRYKKNNLLPSIWAS